MNQKGFSTIGVIITILALSAVVIGGFWLLKFDQSVVSERLSHEQLEELLIVKDKYFVQLASFMMHDPSYQLVKETRNWLTFEPLQSILDSTDNQYNRYVIQQWVDLTEPQRNPIPFAGANEPITFSFNNVSIGPFLDVSEAEAAKRVIADSGYDDAFIFRGDEINQILGLRIAENRNFVVKVEGTRFYEYSKSEPEQILMFRRVGYGYPDIGPQLPIAGAGDLFIFNSKAKKLFTFTFVDGTALLPDNKTIVARMFTPGKKANEGSYGFYKIDTRTGSYDLIKPASGELENIRSVFATNDGKVYLSRMLLPYLSNHTDEELVKTNKVIVTPSNSSDTYKPTPRYNFAPAYEFDIETGAITKLPDAFYPDGRNITISWFRDEEAFSGISKEFFNYGNIRFFRFSPDDRTNDYYVSY